MKRTHSNILIHCLYLFFVFVFSHANKYLFVIFSLYMVFPRKLDFFSHILLDKSPKSFGVLNEGITQFVLELLNEEVHVMQMTLISLPCGP